MKRYLYVLIAVLIFVSPAWAAQDAKTLKGMNIFLSNFAELDVWDVEAKDIAEDYETAVRFGIGHNYINNFKSRIVPVGKAMKEHGDFCIESKYVAESVKKYFGVSVKMEESIEDSEPSCILKDKKFYFKGDDWKKKPYCYARIESIEGPVKGVYKASGVICKADSSKDVLADFEAEFKDYQWKGKKTWVLIKMSSEAR